MQRSSLKGGYAQLLCLQHAACRGSEDRGGRIGGARRPMITHAHDWLASHGLTVRQYLKVRARTNAREKLYQWANHHVCHSQSAHSCVLHGCAAMPLCAMPCQAVMTLMTDIQSWNFSGHVGA